MCDGVSSNKILFLILFDDPSFRKTARVFIKILLTFTPKNESRKSSVLNNIYIYICLKIGYSGETASNTNNHLNSNLNYITKNS